MKRSFWVVLAFLTTVVLGSARVRGSLQAQSRHLTPAAKARFVPWTFHADFDKGISAWMTFPLFQDVGFAPTLYASQDEGRYVLVQDAIAYGQRSLHVGLIKSIHFHAAPASLFKITYKLRLGGPPARARFVLGAFNGACYSASLPDTDGSHAVEITGDELHLPVQGAHVEAVVIEANVSHPISGSHNRLTIQNFGIHAERERAVPVTSPALIAEPGTGIQVADEVVRIGTPLQLKLGSKNSPVKITLYNGSGELAKTEDLAPQEVPQAGHSISLGSRPAPGLWKAELDDGAGATTFRFLVLGKVPPHPRILLSSARIGQLRAQKGSSLLLKAIEARAPKLAAEIAYNPDAGDNIAMLPWSSVHAATPPYFRLMEDYSGAIASNALIYSLTGSPQALAVARRGLLTVCHWRTWAPMGWFPGHTTYYEVGVFSQRVALAYDLIADQLTTAEKAIIVDGFWRNSIAPTAEEYYLLDRLPAATSNWMANSVGGAIALDIAVYGDVPGWENRLGVVLAELMVGYENMLNGGLFPGDGSEAEPAGYENFAMEGMSWGLAALDSLGIRPAKTRRLMDAFWWPYYAMVTPHLVLDTGDFDGRLDQGVSGFAWQAEHSRNPNLHAFYEHAARSLLEALVRSEAHKTLYEQRPGLLNLVCCTKPVSSPTTPPDSRIFPLRGSAVLRSGWNPTDTVISLRVGPWFNHEHHDEGSFQVAAFGEKLISEAGYTGYYKDPHYPDYFTQAAGHNTVLIDEGPFSQIAFNGRFWRAFSRVPRFTGHVFSPAIDYLAADLTPAYDGRLTAYRRDYLFLKPHILLVYDRLEASEAHHFTWLLHIPAGDTPSIQGSEATIQGKAAAALLTATGRNTEWTLHPTPLPIEDYAELDKAQVLPYQEFQLNSASEKAADFLVGMRFARLPETSHFIESLDIPNGEGLQGKIDGGSFAAVFRTGTGALRMENVSTDGEALAVVSSNGKEVVFASHAKVVRRRQEGWVNASSPVEIVLQQNSLETEIRLVASAGADVKVRVERTPSKVEVDHKPVRPLALDGFISLGHLGKGAHLAILRH